MSWMDLPKLEFAFPGPLREKLCAAVLSGAKTSTTGLLQAFAVENEPLPQVGGLTLMVGSRNEPLAVVETTGVQVLRYGDVDLAHALDEGEGYAGLADWREAHDRFFESAQMREYLGEPEFKTSDDTQVVAERFRVVRRIWRSEEVNFALIAEAVALTEGMRAATEAELELPTCCPPWTVKDEFAHTARAVARTLDMLDAPSPTTADAISPADYFEPGKFTVDVNTARVAAAQEAGKQETEELIDWFAAQWREVTGRVADDPDRKVVTRHGEVMLLTDFQATRVLELAVHGLDISDALGREPWLTDAASDVVEAILFGTSGERAREAMGWDRAELLRKTTGRSPLSDAERERLAALSLTWLTLS